MASFLLKALTLQGDSLKAKPQTGPETVDKLVDRVLNATLLEDRRAAVLGLKGLARDWTLEVGTNGMPALVSVLQNDRHDADIIVAAIETLTTLCTRKKTAEDYFKSKSSTSPTAIDSKDLGIMLSEIFLKNNDHITLLLDLLEDHEFYVRFNTVQLLSTLLENLPDRVKECIFVSPGGIARLMDLLEDKRDIIRNEGLLVLISLTTNNAEIQKIVAFENAFERLLGLILMEGAAEGGIVVQDCLTLTLNLLRYNVSNQNLFRESSCIQKIPSLLISHMALEDDKGRPIPVPLTHEANQWPEQKIVNAVAILELVRILVGPNNPNTVVNQGIMNQSKIIASILDLALSDRMPGRVKAQALYAVADIIRSNEKNQDLFWKHVVPPSSPIMNHNFKFPQPALLIIVELALKCEDDFGVRAAAAYCFQSFTFNNRDAQIALAATLTPPPVENPNDEGSDHPQSPGSLLVTTLLNWESSKRDPFRVWFATVMLSHILYENQKAKELALTVRFMDDDGDVSLLHKSMFVLLMASREATDVRILIGVYSMMIHWLHSSVTCVKEFLSEGSNLQFLIEQINQSSGVDPLVQGLATYLLAICHEFNEDLEPSFTQASLQNLIVSRIGADVFMSRIDRLKESKYFQKVSPYYLPSESTKGLPDVYFDATFVDLLKSTADSMIRAVISPKSKSKKSETSESVLESYKSLIASQDKEIQRLRKELHSSELKFKEENELLRAEVATTSQQHLAIQSALSEKTQAYDALAQEQEDLLICLAESDIKMDRMKVRLRELGDIVDSDNEDGEEEIGGT